MDFGWSYVAQRVITLWRDRRVCQSADRVLVLGPGLEHDLMDGHGVDPHRVEWLPSEIDTELFFACGHFADENPITLHWGDLPK